MLSVNSRSQCYRREIHSLDDERNYNIGNFVIIPASVLYQSLIEAYDLEALHLWIQRSVFAGFTHLTT